MRSSIKLLIMFVFVIILSASCIRYERSPLKTYSQSPEDYSATLIVFPEAENLVYEKQYGRDGVAYTVKIEYPAPNVVSYISRNLDNLGYHPLRKDYWNPGMDIPSSHVRGWTGHRDPTVTTNRWVKQWLAQWQNENGDLVIGALRYENPVGQVDDWTNLKVFVGYYPASAAKALLETLTEEMKKLEASSKEREKLAEELLIVQRMDKTIQEAYDQIKQMQISQIMQMNLSDEEIQEYHAMREKIIDFVSKQLRWESVRNEYIQIYAVTFSEKELKGLIEFYKSPLGQLFLDKTPGLTTETMQISQRRMDTIMPKILEFSEEMNKKKLESRKKKTDMKREEQVYADPMYADHVTNINRGDPTIGNFKGYYGGTSSETSPIELTKESAMTAVLGAPDGSFLSLPGDTDTPSGAGFQYTSIQVGFPSTFGANNQLLINELGGNLESAVLWIWTLDGSNVQPRITRNGTDTLVVDLKQYAEFVSAHGGAFDRVGIGGLDTLGASQGFDLDAVGVAPVR